jgi:hypothetical protein
MTPEGMFAVAVLLLLAFLYGLMAWLAWLSDDKHDVYFYGAVAVILLGTGVIIVWLGVMV